MRPRPARARSARSAPANPCRIRARARGGAERVAWCRPRRAARPAPRRTPAAGCPRSRARGAGRASWRRRAAARAAASGAARWPARAARWRRRRPPRHRARGVRPRRSLLPRARRPAARGAPGARPGPTERANVCGAWPRSRERGYARGSCNARASSPLAAEHRGTLHARHRRAVRVRGGIPLAGELAAHNVDRSYSLAATSIAIFTFVLLFLYPRFESGELDALLFHATLVVMGVATFSFMFASFYY